MAIDFSETLIRTKDVPSQPFIPEGSRGRITEKTVYNWMNRGVKGVKLDALKVGGFLCTTKTALLAFFQAVSASKAPETRGRRKKAG